MEVNNAGEFVLAFQEKGEEKSVKTIATEFRINLWLCEQDARRHESLEKLQEQSASTPEWSVEAEKDS